MLDVEKLGRYEYVFIMVKLKLMNEDVHSKCCNQDDKLPHDKVSCLNGLSWFLAVMTVGIAN